MIAKTQPKTRKQTQITQPAEEPAVNAAPKRMPNPLVLKQIFDRIAEWEEELIAKKSAGETR